MKHVFIAILLFTTMGLAHAESDNTPKVRLTFSHDAVLERMQLPWGQVINYGTTPEGVHYKTFENFNNGLKGPYFEEKSGDFTNVNNYRFGVHNELVRRLEDFPHIKDVLDYYFDESDSIGWFERVRPYLIDPIEDGFVPSNVFASFKRHPELRGALAAWVASVLYSGGNQETYQISNRVLARSLYYLTIYAVWMKSAAVNSLCSLTDSAASHLQSTYPSLEIGSEEMELILGTQMMSLMNLCVESTEFRFHDVTGFESLEDAIRAIAEGVFDIEPLLIDVFRLHVSEMRHQAKVVDATLVPLSLEPDINDAYAGALESLDRCNPFVSERIRYLRGKGLIRALPDVEDDSDSILMPEQESVSAFAWSTRGDQNQDAIALTNLLTVPLEDIDGILQSSWHDEQRETARWLYYGDGNFSRERVFQDDNSLKATILAHEFFHTRQFLTSKYRFYSAQLGVAIALREMPPSVETVADNIRDSWHLGEMVAGFVESTFYVPIKNIIESAAEYAALDAMAKCIHAQTEPPAKPEEPEFSSGGVLILGPDGAVMVDFDELMEKMESIDGELKHSPGDIEQPTFHTLEEFLNEIEKLDTHNSH